MKYLYIICPLTTLVICQAVKTIYEILKNKKFSLDVIASSGGMPSAHSSFVTSLTFIIGLNEGFDTSIFALSLVFAMITCYDAMNVRYECGKHAEVLNKQFNLQMKEKVGHKLLEVVCGAILGIIFIFIFYFKF